jgi:hypothetical protein
MLRGIIRDSSSYRLEFEYENLWYGLLRECGILEQDNFLRCYMWNMYSTGSSYYEVSINIRSSVVYRYEFSNVMGESDYMDRINLCSCFIERYLGLVESQEERVYRELRDRIDRLVEEYSRSDVDIDKLDIEPKKVKAIGELLGIKEKLGQSIGRGIRNRGNRRESLIEGL